MAPTEPSPTRVGVVGGGQLALMMAEAAKAAEVRLTVLAASPDDPAVSLASDALVGAATDGDALARLAERVDVITFDHELVDLAQLQRLEARGVVMRPSPAALRLSVDKSFQRVRLRDAAVPVPAFVVTRDPDDPALRPFLDTHPATVVKAATGGYDGRGVVFCEGADEARRAVERFGVAVVEERLELRSELAQLVVRGPDGQTRSYPLVTTVQDHGMCVETIFPACLDAARRDEAAELAGRIAELSGVVGALAVELFDVGGRLIVNEVALRPHNTGHWTIEGARTSQFENHLRAVAGRRLGPTDPTVAAAVMVNLVGGDRPPRPARSSAPDIFVHDYRKEWRPGRKIGHVTALADDADRARVAAWSQARAIGAAPREVP